MRTFRLLDPAELAPVPVLRFTVAEYSELGNSGVLPEEPCTSSWKAGAHPS